MPAATRRRLEPAPRVQLARPGTGQGAGPQEPPTQSGTIQLLACAPPCPWAGIALAGRRPLGWAAGWRGPRLAAGGTAHQRRRSQRGGSSTVLFCSAGLRSLIKAGRRQTRRSCGQRVICRSAHCAQPPSGPQLPARCLAPCRRQQLLPLPCPASGEHKGRAFVFGFRSWRGVLRLSPGPPRRHPRMV